MAPGNACTTTGPIPTVSCSTTTDSNTWANTSTHTYTLTPRPDGKTDIDVVVVRHGKNLKGHVLAAAFTVIGKSFLGKAFSNTVKAIEARNYGTRPGRPGFSRPNRRT